MSRSRRPPPARHPGPAVSLLLTTALALLLGGAARGGAPIPLEAQANSEVHRSAAEVLRNGRQALTVCNGLFVSDRTTEQLYRGELSRMSAPLPPSRMTVDQERRTVTVPGEDGDRSPAMRAMYQEGLGCIIGPPGSDGEDDADLPVLTLPPPPGDPDTLPWPVGDRTPDSPLPDNVNAAALEAAGEWAFDRSEYDGQTTVSLLVVHEGEIVYERYAPGFDEHTMTRTWSAAKSLASTLIGIGVDRRLLELDAPLPFPWEPDELNEYRRRHAAGFDMISWEGWPPTAAEPAPDPRSEITLRHVLHMSSGLYPVDNERGTAIGSSHCYFAGRDCAHDARDRGMVREPGTVWDYENHDTLLGVVALRTALGDDEAFLAFPRTALMDRLGMRHTVPGVDRFGTFIMSSQVYMNARDLARLGLLYLNRGMWEGERILSEEWVDFVRTPAPSTADFGRFYGGQWWLVPDHRTDLPADAYTAAGAAGQYAIVVPSRDLVVVRRGLDASSTLSVWDLLAEVLQAFPRAEVEARKPVAGEAASR